MGLIKLFQVINLLIRLEKVVEIVAANLLSEFSEVFFKHYSGQMRVRKQQFAIDAVASLVPKVQKSWVEKN